MRMSSRPDPGRPAARATPAWRAVWLLAWLAGSPVLAPSPAAAQAAPGVAATPADPLPARWQARLDAAVAAYASGRHEQAHRAFEALAREDVPAALHNLGVMHLRRELPRPDPAVARRLLARAAELGFVTSMFTLGQAHEEGAFGARDLTLACDWYEQAARRGSVEGQVAIGTAHYLGRGRARDPAAALPWFRLAAQAGDVGAMYLVAAMYEAGDGVAQDLRLARHWYGAAARAGDVAAPGKVREIEARLSSQPG